jgi:hypothetical protein
MTTKVVTWQAPSGGTINITRKQERMLHSAGVWPRTSRGEEYCSVSHGLHVGAPSMSDEQIYSLIAAAS